jgi:hypothetical protein
LVKTDAELAIGQLLDLLRAEVHGLMDGINHHEVVAGTLHFAKS